MKKSKRRFLHQRTQKAQSKAAYAAIMPTKLKGSAREVDHGDIKVEDLAMKIKKPAKVVSVENMSPLLDHEDAVYVFMGAGDIQLYERSFEELLSSLTNNRQ